jgi:hypothetical protein
VFFGPLVCPLHARTASDPRETRSSRERSRARSATHSRRRSRRTREPRVRVHTKSCQAFSFAGVHISRGVRSADRHDRSCTSSVSVREDQEARDPGVRVCAHLRSANRNSMSTRWRGDVRSPAGFALGRHSSSHVRSPRARHPRSGPRCSSGPKGGGSRPSRAARRRRDSACCDGCTSGAGAPRAQAARRASPRPRPMNFHVEHRPMPAGGHRSRLRSRRARRCRARACVHGKYDGSCAGGVRARASFELARALALRTASAFRSPMFFGAEGRGFTPVARCAQAA